jgi:alpha-1,2-mannosyltransferase
MSRIARALAFDWLGRERVLAYSRIFLVLYVAIAAGWVALSHGLVDRLGKPIGTDFVNVYAAGELALAGEPAAAWDWTRHRDAERAIFAIDNRYYGWHYPPIFLLVAAPLALLPYAAALAVYLAIGLALYWLVMRRVVPTRAAMLPALAFPGVFANVGHGQNGFLTLALLGGGLVLLDRRPLLAGGLIGLLAYKPQFALLAPVALLAGGHWRALLAAAASAVAVSLLALLVFGAESWVTFLDSGRLTREIILEQGATGWERIVSVFAAVRMLGGGIGPAYAAQGLAALAAAVAMVRLWRGAAPLRLKAAGLCAGIPLATPYLLDYDLVLLALPSAWLAGEGLRAGFRSGEKAVLVAAWLLPLLARPIGLGLHLPIAPLVVAALVVAVLRRAAATVDPLSAPNVRSLTA